MQYPLSDDPDKEDFTAVFNRSPLTVPTLGSKFISFVLPLIVQSSRRQEKADQRDVAFLAGAGGDPVVAGAAAEHQWSTGVDGGTAGNWPADHADDSRRNGRREDREGVRKLRHRV